MYLHDLIVDEFKHTKSLSALVYLLEHGREIEFSFEGRKYFISRSQFQKQISFWDNQKEQSFDSIEELIENADVLDTALLNICSKIQLETIF